MLYEFAGLPHAELKQIYSASFLSWNMYSQSEYKRGMNAFEW